MIFLRRLQKFYGVKVFLFCSSLCALCFFAHMYYFNGSLRMIEKQYGLSARQTGILDGVDNTMAIALLLIYGYLGDRYNKPRLIGFGTFMISLSSFFMTLPHFIITPPRYDQYANRTSRIEFNNKVGLFQRSPVDIMCAAENKTCSSVRSHQDLATSAAGTRALYILLAGRVIFGVGAPSIYTLMVSYVYENSDKHKSPLCLGILHATFLLGPVLGYLMAGAANRLPVDLKDYNLKPEDPRFIGCWWMGFVVIGVLGLFGCVPVFTFPAKIKPRTRRTTDTKTEDNSTGFGKYVRKFCRTVRNLITSPLYILYTLSNIFLIYVVVILINILPRYLEFHFRLPIYKTSLIQGVALTLPALIGSLLGGFILSYFKLRDVTMARMVVTMLLVQVVFVGLMMSVHCPETEYEGFRVDTTSGSVNMSTSCSMPCKCDISGAQPVCGSDGRDYFTPCHAGCTDISMEGKKLNFTKCQCVQGGWAVTGHCLPSCQLVIPYVMIEALDSLGAAVMNIPLRILILRAIPGDAKAFGLAFGAFSYNLFGRVPGPIISGMLVDLTCQIWQRRCGRRGSCLQYHLGNLRKLTHWGGMLFYSLASLAAILAYQIHRRMAGSVGQGYDDVTSKLTSEDDSADNDEHTSLETKVKVHNVERDLVKVEAKEPF